MFSYVSSEFILTSSRMGKHSIFQLPIVEDSQCCHCISVLCHGGIILRTLVFMDGWMDELQEKAL